jgi:hypothetical protein
MEQRTKEGLSANPVFSVYDEESNNGSSDSMSPTWDKIASSWDTLGYEHSIWGLTGNGENSLAKK